MPSPLTLPLTYGRQKPPLGAPLRGATASMQGCYTLNEGAGAPWNARPLLSGPVMARSLSGLTWAAGLAGPALLAHASTDYADTGAHTNLAFSAGTVICRVYQSWNAGDGQTHCWWGHRSTGGNLIFEFSKDASNLYYAGWYNAGTDTRISLNVNGTTNAVQHAWQTYAFSWDAAGSYLYRFGEPGDIGVSGLLVSGAAPSLCVIGTSFWLGASHNGGGSMGAGALLDYVLLDARRWSLAEVRAFALAPFAVF